MFLLTVFLRFNTEVGVVGVVAVVGLIGVVPVVSVAVVVAVVSGVPVAALVGASSGVRNCKDSFLPSSKFSKHLDRLVSL